MFHHLLSLYIDLEQGLKVGCNDFARCNLYFQGLVTKEENIIFSHIVLVTISHPAWIPGLFSNFESPQSRDYEEKSVSS